MPTADTPAPRLPSADPALTPRPTREQVDGALRRAARHDLGSDMAWLGAEVRALRAELVQSAAARLAERVRQAEEAHQIDAATTHHLLTGETTQPADDTCRALLAEVALAAGYKGQPARGLVEHVAALHGAALAPQPAVSDGPVQVGTPDDPDRAACPHCEDGHRDPRDVPWGVRVASERDHDGQPTHLRVERTQGSHVAQSDADWLWHLIRHAPTQPAVPDGEDAPARLDAALAAYHEQEEREPDLTADGVFERCMRAAVAAALSGRDAR